jgi:hypothetical protein
MGAVELDQQVERWFARQLEAGVAIGTDDAVELSRPSPPVTLATESM